MWNSLIGFVLSVLMTFLFAGFLFAVMLGCVVGVKSVAYGRCVKVRDREAIRQIAVCWCARRFSRFCRYVAVVCFLWLAGTLAGDLVPVSMYEVFVFVDKIVRAVACLVVACRFVCGMVARWRSEQEAYREMVGLERGLLGVCVTDCVAYAVGIFVACALFLVVF